MRGRFGLRDYHGVLLTETTTIGDLQGLIGIGLVPTVYAHGYIRLEETGQTVQHSMNISPGTLVLWDGPGAHGLNFIESHDVVMGRWHDLGGNVWCETEDYDRWVEDIAKAKAVGDVAVRVACPHCGRSK